MILNHCIKSLSSGVVRRRISLVVTCNNGASIGCETHT